MKKALFFAVLGATAALMAVAPFPAASTQPLRLTDPARDYVNTEILGQAYDDGWQNRYQSIWDYNADDQPVVADLNRWSEDHWTSWKHTITTYENNLPFMIESVLYDPVEGDTILSRAICTYEDGLLASKLCQVDQGEGWEPSSRLDYSYLDGLLDHVIEQDWVDGEWVEMIKNVYQYDDQSQLTHELTQYYEDSGWISYQDVSHTRVDGVETECMVSQWDGAAWNATDLTGYLYDNQGRKTEEDNYEFHENEWMASGRVLFNYDANSLISMTVSQMQQDDQTWTDSGRSLYTWEQNTAGEDDVIPSDAFDLSNAPNPFNPETGIVYSLPVSGRVNVSVYDLRGRIIRNLVDETQPAGEHRLRWNGRDAAGATVSTGLYFCRLSSGGVMATRKLLLLK
jgi:hypothetical protein